MGSSKLSLYNGACLILKQRRLSGLSDTGPARQALDLVYDDTVQYMLEQGLWNHAQRSVALTPDPDVTPSFGFRNAFEHPADMVRITKISPSERFYPTLEHYLDEGGYFYADIQTMYLMYVSNGADHGLDLSRWPASFSRAVEFELALRIGPTIGITSNAIDDVEKRGLRALRDARSKDALRQPAEDLQPGRLVKSRHNGRSSGRGIWD